MRTKLILTFLSLLLPTMSVLAQQSPVIRFLPSEQKGSDASTVPNKIAFISDIGGGQSLYVVDPNRSDVKIFGKLHIEGVQIPRHDLLFSPDRKQVIFVASSNFGRDAALWVVNTNGSGARKLMDWKWVRESPFAASCSPTGDHVGFRITEENLSKIYVMKSDGSDFHFVADGDQLSWSPDGHQLAVTTYVPEKQARYVRVVNIDGTNLREISTGGSAVECTWSPDGKRIAFSEAHAETTSEAKFDVFVVAPDGTQKETVHENITLYSPLDWSPDAQFLSFVANFEGNHGIYVWSTREPRGKRFRFLSGVGAPYEWSPDSKQIAYGGNIVSIFDLKLQKARMLFHTAGFGRPLWLPDGNHLLVYNTRELQSYRDSPDLDLYITQIESHDINRLTDDRMHVLDISCPPNGKVIAFVAKATTNDGTSNSVAYSINSDGSNLRKLSVTRIESGWFAWSNDGRKIAFVKEMTNCTGCRPGNLQIQVANADGSDEQTIVNEPAWNFAPAWLPDGKGIIFISDRGNTHGVYITDIKSKRTQRVADVSRWLPSTLTHNPNQRSIPIIWSPDATKFATALPGERPGKIRVIDVKKPATAFEVFGISPSVVSWTPDSRRIAVRDLVHDMVMNSITPSYVDLVAVDGSSRIKITPAFVDYAPQLFRMAWTLDGKHFAYSGIVTFDADGSHRRWIVSGTRPAWVQ